MGKRAGIALFLILAAGLMYWAGGELGWTEVALISEMEEGVPYLHEVNDVALYMVLLENGPIALKTDDPHPKACDIRWNEEEEHFSEPCLGSIYEVDGGYRSGPSPRSMDQYSVRIRNGAVQVRLNSVSLGEARE